MGKLGVMRGLAGVVAVHARRAWARERRAEMGGGLGERTRVGDWWTDGGVRAACKGLLSTPAYVPGSGRFRLRLPKLGLPRMCMPRLG